MERAELTGHTALGLVTLVGFFVYTSSYSLVYNVVRSGATTKPVAVLEMWMVFTHLISAAVTCATYAVFSFRTGDVQTAIFLGIALSVTACGVECINDSNQCRVFFPAAAWAPLAASGAIAWSWIVYVASLGCQASFVSLGASTSHIVSPLVIALFAPSVTATLKETCGIGNPPLSLALHLTLLVLAFGVWNCSLFVLGKPATTSLALRVLAAVLLITDSFVAVQGAAAWVILVLVISALFDGQVIDLLFGSGGRATNNKQQLHLQ